MTRTGPLVALVILLSACGTWVTDILEFGSLEVRTVTRSGVPVSGSELVLYNDVQIMGVGFTNSNGVHRFDFVPPQFYGVHNEPPDGHMRPEDVVGGPSTAYIQGITMKEGDEQSVSFTFVKVGPGRIDVSVTDPNGTPIENTEVFLYGPEGTLSEKIIELSGSVSFDPVSFGNRAVRVIPPRQYLDSDEGFFFQHGILIDEGWTEEVSFVLQKCLGTVRGSVQDASGAPVAAHPLRLYSSTETLELKDTRADGVALFDSIPCGNRGLSLVETPGWIFNQGRGLSFYDGISVTQGSDQTFSFSVERCSGTIRASVQDASGAPVAAHPLRLYSSTETLDVKDTGADGLAVFDSIGCGGPRGLALVETPEWFFEEGRGLSFYDGISVTQGSDQTFSFSVERCSGTIRASVQDASGAPVAAHPLRLYSSTETLDVKDTGADGLAVFDSIGCGGPRGLALVETPEWFFEEGRGLSFYDGISVTQGSDQTFSFSVERCSGTIRASVQDASGAPVAAHPLRLYSSTETLDVKDTGADGLAVFDSIGCGGPRGLALVETPEWFFEEGRGLSFYDGISVTQGSDQTFSFSVERCSGTIRASVQDASGAPVAAHPLRLYSSTETLDVKDTGADGLAVFDSIGCGGPRGLALVQRPGWLFEEGRGLSFYDGISVTQGSDQTFSFSVERCSGEIGVRVEDEGGTPVNGAALELYAGGRTWDQGVTGSDGLLSFTEACGVEIGVRVIPPAGYTVPPGRGFSFYDGLRPDLGGRVELVFRLQAS